MALKERYEVDDLTGKSLYFDSVMDAVTEAMSISELGGGVPVKVYRAVKYTTEEHFKRYTLNTVTMPKEAIELGITIGEDDGVKASSNTTYDNINRSMGSYSHGF